MTRAKSIEKYEEIGSDDMTNTSCWYQFRRSKTLVVLIVFIAMMLDLMLITSVGKHTLMFNLMLPHIFLFSFSFIIIFRTNFATPCLRCIATECH